MEIAAEVWQSLDKGLLVSFQFGIGIGILILSGLILFPGRKSLQDEPVSMPSAKDNLPSSPKGEDSIDAAEDQNTGTGWDPHRRLNAIVYVILITIVVVTLEHEYGGAISKMFRLHFPREATWLGYDPIAVGR